MTNSDAETKLLPLTVSVTPCCTSANVTVLGKSEPIKGAGRALLHRGFRALLQPRAENARTIRQAKDTPQVRTRMGDTPLGWCSPSGCLSTTSRSGVKRDVPAACSPSANAKRPLAFLIALFLGG